MSNKSDRKIIIKLPHYIISFSDAPYIEMEENASDEEDVSDQMDNTTGNDDYNDHNDVSEADAFSESVMMRPKLTMKSTICLILMEIVQTHIYSRPLLKS